MKKLFRILLPEFIFKLNQELLVRFPLIWASKFLFLLFFSVCISVISIGCTLIMPVSIDNVSNVEAITYLVAFANAVFFLIWTFNQSIIKFRILHGITDRWHDLRVGLIFFSAGMLMLVSFFIPTFIIKFRLASDVLKVDVSGIDKYYYAPDSSVVNEWVSRNNRDNYSNASVALSEKGGYTPRAKHLAFGYSGKNYTGDVIPFERKAYSPAELLVDRIFLGRIKSLRLHWDYELVVYKRDNFQGDSLVISSNMQEVSLLGYQSALVRQCRQKTPRYAVLYEDCYYVDTFPKNGHVKILPGTYQKNDFIQNEFGVDKLSSIDLPIGYYSYLFQEDSLMGNSVYLDNSNACLVFSDFNDVTTSLTLTKDTNEVDLFYLTEGQDYFEENIPTAMTGRLLKRTFKARQSNGDTMQLSVFLFYDSLRKQDVVLAPQELAPYFVYAQIQRSLTAQDPFARQEEYNRKASAIGKLNSYRSTVLIELIILSVGSLILVCYFIIVSSNGISFFGMKRYLLSLVSFSFIFLIVYLVLDTSFRSYDTSKAEKVFYSISLPALVVLFSYFLTRFQRKPGDMLLAMWIGFGAPIGALFSLAYLMDQVFQDNANALRVFIPLFLLTMTALLYHVPKQFYRMYCQPSR